MPTAEAHVRTERASRYLVQLCRHAGQMGRHQLPRPHAGGEEAPEVLHVEWDDAHGIVTLNWGTWTLDAASDTLTLRAEAPKCEDLQRIQDLLAARVEKIGRRDRLTVVWQRPDTPAPTEKSGNTNNITRRWSSTRAWVLVGIVAVLIAVHLGLGGAALAASRWTDWTVIGLVALFLVKAIGLRVLATRRGKAFHAPGNGAARAFRNHLSRKNTR